MVGLGRKCAKSGLNNTIHFGRNIIQPNQYGIACGNFNQYHCELFPDFEITKDILYSFENIQTFCSDFICLYCTGPICDVLTYTDPGSSSASVTWNIPGNDNVDSSITVMQTTSYTQGQSFSIGTTNIMYSVSDTSGNTATVSIAVKVLGTNGIIVLCICVLFLYFM